MLRLRHAQLWSEGHRCRRRRGASAGHLRERFERLAAKYAGKA